MHRIKLYGLGGQGVVTASLVLARAAAIGENRFARNLPAYGHERRGAPVSADVMIDDQPILLSCFVQDPNLVVVFDATAADKGIDIARGIAPGAILVINSDDPQTVRRLGDGFSVVYSVNASRIARQVLGRDIPNSAMLGAVARTGIVGLDSICESIRQAFGGPAGDLNAAAATEAYRQTDLALRTGEAEGAPSLLQRERAADAAGRVGPAPVGRRSRGLLGPVATVVATVHTGSWRSVRPQVDSPSCVRCGICDTSCPPGVIDIRKDGPVALEIDWATCKGCGICAEVCPKGCIEMVEEKR